MVDTLNNNDERSTLRTRICAQRKALTSKQLHKAELALMRHCLPLVNNVKSIAGYKAINGEIAVDALLNTCAEKQATTLLPIMRGKQLLFAPFNKNTSFITHGFGIDEPDVAEGALWQPMDIEAVLVPLVAFDAQCHRIGMGGGFYDRSFTERRSQQAPPLLIGVAHACQQQPQVPNDWWDVPLDFVVTDEQVIKRPSN